MNASRSLYALAVVALIGLAGCGTPPGRPRKGSEALAPNEVMGFDALYRENCAACHGADGRGGAAIALANPVYLAIASDDVVRSVIAAGVTGTSMPAFAQHAGGMLTDQQIDVITTGMRTRWSRPATSGWAHPPAYTATSSGDAQRGEAVYRRNCESCHGSDGAVDRRAAGSRTTRFSRWSAIRGCAPSSSAAARSSVRPIGADTPLMDQ